jgi:putative nucleotidyltransferase with HDIG domain
MPLYPNANPLVSRAERSAVALLGHDPDRLAHSRTAARIAEQVTDVLGIEDPELVVAATWLHDVGYAPTVVRTGFHPLDGALHLADEGWPDETVLLVAHHSYASVLAPYFGVEEHLSLLDHAPFDAEDVLVYADLLSGPTGMGASPEDRIKDKRARLTSPACVPSKVREDRYRLLLAAATRVSAALNARPTGWKARRRPSPDRL